MRYILILAVLLMGCDTASPAFRGVEAQRITVGQSTFDIRVRENRAEVIRINSEWAPRMAAVEPRARAAIAKVSGCEVKRLRGDQAMMVADLKCGESAVPLAPQEPLTCELDGKPRALPGEVFIDLSCE
jgi:hypothetical protein